MPRALSNRSIIVFRLLGLFCLAAVVVPLEPAAGREAAPRILFIGNSYTGQIRAMLTDLVAASPYADAIFEFITPGGRTLEQHLANPNTIDRIRNGNWDIVVLQDQSQTPALFPGKFEKAARQLNHLITEAGALTAFYQTWGRRDGDRQNPDRFPDYATMQDALTKAYGKTAHDLEATLIPVGSAWHALREGHPDLGRQLYKNDGSHPSSQGAYLAACLFYAILFHDNPDTVPFDPGFEARDASKLRTIAWAWSSGTPD
jgi:hypothetical protein